MLTVFKRIAFLCHLIELGFEQRTVGNSLLGMGLERIEQHTLCIFSGLKGQMDFPRSRTVQWQALPNMRDNANGLVGFNHVYRHNFSLPHNGHIGRLTTGLDNLTQDGLGLLQQSQVLDIGLPELQALCAQTIVFSRTILFDIAA